MARLSTTVLALCVTSALSASAAAFINASVGGHEGEIDLNAHFIAELGKVEPTERPSSFQSADIKIVNLGAGYTIGRVGPLQDFYLRIEGNYYTSDEESVENASNFEPPVGYRFFDHDRGGWITATVATNLVHESRFAFGLFLQGTVPIDVDLGKFSNPQLHWVGGGTTVGVFITDPTKLVRLAYAGRVFVGSGAYGTDEAGFDVQDNPAVASTNLFVLEAARWILPWRIGVAVGPYFEGDLGEHVNRAYHDAYGNLSADLIEGDRIRAMRFAVAVLPYFRITDHAAIELGYVQKLFGYDAIATQFYTAGVRTTF